MNAKANFLAANLRPGELYAGLMLDVDGRDYHLISLPEEVVGVTWQNAINSAWIAGGSLPTRSEQSLLYANLKSQFQPNWYWSCEQHGTNDGYVWCQNFATGYQCTTIKADRLRLHARPVRRIYIEQEGE